MDSEHTILRLPATIAQVGKCRSSIYRDVAAGTFPQPVKLGARSIGFLKSEVDAWVADRVKVSRATQRSA